MHSDQWCLIDDEVGVVTLHPVTRVITEPIRIAGIGAAAIVLRGGPPARPATQEPHSNRGTYIDARGLAWGYQTFFQDPRPPAVPPGLTPAKLRRRHPTAGSYLPVWRAEVDGLAVAGLDRSLDPATSPPPPLNPGNAST